MTDWSALNHAYGSAEDLPELFRQLETEPTQELWGQLWSRLCHQGTVYPASFAALEWLTGIAEKGPPDHSDHAVILAGAIIADVNAAGHNEIHDRCGESISRLRQVAERRLRADNDYWLYLVQALLAFEGVPVWGRNLDCLVDGECAVCCPVCGLEMFIVFNEYGFFSAGDDYVTEPDVQRKPLHPADPAQLQGLPQRLYELMTNAAQPRLAEGLRYLFGRAECPHCPAVFTVADQIRDTDTASKS